MPVPALSLVGFMSQGEAQSYLRERCRLPRVDNLGTVWNEARGRLGGRQGNPGFPDIMELPAEASDYLEGVRNHPRFQDSLAQGSIEFRFVEIDPLLAFQHHLVMDRSSDLCQDLSQPPTLEELLTIALPHDSREIPIEVQVVAGQLPGQVVFEIRSESLNLRPVVLLRPDEDLTPGLAGVQVGEGSNLVQVGRFDGRCYLRNGFHRTYGARVAGATHIPCIFQDFANYDDLGVGGGFNRKLMSSENPPTLRHFAQGKATEVPLRIATRKILVGYVEAVEWEP